MKAPGRAAGGQPTAAIGLPVREIDFFRSNVA